MISMATDALMVVPNCHGASDATKPIRNTQTTLTLSGAESRKHASIKPSKRAALAIASATAVRATRRFAPAPKTVSKTTHATY